MSEKTSTNNTDIALAQIAYDLTPPAQSFGVGVEAAKKRVQFFTTTFVGLLETKKNFDQEGQLTNEQFNEMFKWTG